MSLAVESLRRVVQSVPEHQVAWVARDGAEAVKRCSEDLPDLILMDLIMPVMNGAEATRKIMASTPCPILVVTSSVGGNASLVFEAMGFGALDAVRTPVLAHSGADGAAGLLHKIATIEKLTRTGMAKRVTHTGVPRQENVGQDGCLVAIGASTGGPKALATILSHLPPDYPAGIVIVQHVDAQFSAELADWLNEQSPLQVRLAREGDRPKPGTALIAGTNDHLVFNSARRLMYTPEPREQVYRPSVDVFFDSVALRWRGPVVAVLLTGMGRDGSQGMLRLRDNKVHTIAEHQSTCAVYGMPKAAVQLNAAVEVLPVQHICRALIKHFPPAADKGRRGAAI